MADVTTIDRALDAFMDAKNWVETRAILEERRELLLSTEAIARLVFRVSLRKNERQRASMALHARLLLLARDEGIVAAWEWLADRLARRKRIQTQVEELSQAPQAEAQERLRRLVESFGPADMLIFQEELEEAEPAPARGNEESGGNGGAGRDRSDVRAAVAEYLGAKSWSDALDLFRERRETLLTAEAERMLREAARHAQEVGEPDAAGQFTRHAEVLRIARDQGIEAARAYIARLVDETRISPDRPRAPTAEERAAVTALLAIPNAFDANTARVVRAWLGEPGYEATTEEIALMRVELREALR